MPTRIYFKDGNHSIVVVESFEEVVETLQKAQADRWDTVIFEDYEQRYGDRRLMVAASHVDYCKPARISI